MRHKKLDIYTKEEFTNEIVNFAKITNKRSRGFRAPTFSLNHNTSWTLDVLVENDYLYDSSIVPAKTRLYGVPDADTKPYKISSSNISKNNHDSGLLEFPLMVGKFFGKKIPTGGGFYLRLLPINTIENTIKKYESENKPATFYIHSWELTPEYMPKITLPLSDRFITYHNLYKAMPKMDSLVKKFQFTSFEKYLNKIN